jgi:hypothetical protein
MLTRGQEYTDLGQHYYEERYRERVPRQLYGRFCKNWAVRLTVSNWPVSDRRVRQSLTVGKPTLRLLGDLQRIVDLDAEIPHDTLKFGMAE